MNKQNKSNKFKKEKKPVHTLGLRNEIYFFIENLSALLSAGMGIIAALSSIKDDLASRRMRKLVGFIYKEIQDGSSFFSTLEKARILPMHTLSLIRAGEMSGRLIENLQVVVLQNEKEKLFRSKLRSSLLYAVVVTALTVIIGAATAIFTLPKLASFFSEIEAELPVLTRWLIAAGNFLENFGYIIIPVALLILFLAFYFLFSFPKTKFIGHSLLFHIPVIKNLIKQAELARFGFLLGSMLEAGMSAKESLANLPHTTTFQNYSKFYLYLEEKVGAGNSFQNCFSSYKNINKLFPPAVRQLITAAEKSGKLSETFFRIGQMYEKKVEATARNLPILLEPILIIIIGLMVAVLAIGIILPIYSLSDVI